MTARPARRQWALWLGLSLCAAAGCASPNQAAGVHTGTTAAEPTAGEESFVCATDGLDADEVQSEYVPASVSEETSGAPAPVRAGAPPAPRGGGSDALPPSTSRREGYGADESSDVPELFQSQGANLGALACALDAADCESAAHLGEQICRLAARICDLEDADPRCPEARSRCERANARIRSSCPAALPPQSPVTP
ncbi:MAG: hypothetical protein H6725_09650 [Sandaracinaceae bacterium]|nr:hypothetical protein [Sandaracinaceae bacterium]